MKANETTTEGNDLKEIESFDLSIIPVSTQKKPFSAWKNYQTEYAPYQGWREHYCNGGYVGIITGKISGGLECIDIDVKNDPLGSIYDEFKDIIPKDLFNRLIIQTTPNDGYHLIYRCPEAVIDKSMKLTLHSDRAVIIETRGEAGYFCTSKTNNDERGI